MDAAVASRPTTIALYLAAALVLGFELFVLGLALRPTVSDAYRAYYIDRTSDCWRSQREPPVLRPGEPLRFTPQNADRLRPVMGCGWHDPESWGAWTKGERAELTFKLEPPLSDLVLKAEVRAFSGRRPAQEVTVRVNGAAIATWTVPQEGNRTVTARIPQGLLGSPELSILFEIRHPAAPAEVMRSSDHRKLGLGVSSLTIDRAQPTAD
jgi:hypothetical protein